MWAEDNTEGFIDEELATINRALGALATLHEDVEPWTLNDLINNAWTQGAAVEQLVERVNERLGRGKERGP